MSSRQSIHHYETGSMNAVNISPKNG